MAASKKTRKPTGQGHGPSAGKLDEMIETAIVDAFGESERMAAVELRAAFDILFGLMDDVDQGNDHVIFYAAEGGPWQVDVDWTKVLPPWFWVPSVTATPEERAKRITSLIRHRRNHDCERMLAAVSNSATAEQREALAKAPKR
jgi:hypothetical protein